MFNLERTLGIDEEALIKLETEVANYNEELDLLCDATEEQKLEVNVHYFYIMINKIYLVKILNTANKLLDIIFKKS